jgi:hypothetical protein
LSFQSFIPVSSANLWQKSMPALGSRDSDVSASHPFILTAKGRDHLFQDLVAGRDDPLGIGPAERDCAKANRERGASRPDRLPSGNTSLPLIGIRFFLPRSMSWQRSSSLGRNAAGARPGPPPKETRPSLPLPDGDRLDPMPVLAADLGMDERGFREWASDRNVRMRIFNGMSYASRADALTPPLPTYWARSRSGSADQGLDRRRRRRVTVVTLPSDPCCASHSDQDAKRGEARRQLHQVRPAREGLLSCNAPSRASSWSPTRPATYRLMLKSGSGSSASVGNPGAAIPSGRAAGGGLGYLGPPVALRIRYPQRYPIRGIAP